MGSPQFIEEQPVPLAEVKGILSAVEKRDTELNYRSNKVKEFLENFPSLSAEKKKELHEKLLGLNLTRLKEEHIVKIIDFLPKTLTELKVVLQAYPLTIPKKDQESTLAVVKDFVPA